ncbi:MAG: DUF655 domain-containing protein [DPANN group archaeon]|nr:DUF655 domain-containing protein [DPANN group archaeon]
MFKENSAIILDFLPTGYASGFKKEPVAQAIGEDFLTLLELTPKPNVSFSLREKVYIGKDERDKVQFIKGRITFDKLTATARNELEAYVKDRVQEQEAKYVEFFNKAGPITVRQHSLELLPNIGKKHMWDIINARDKKPFESFKDIEQRVALMPDPRKVVIERMMDEFKGGEKYYLFIRPPAPKTEQHEGRFGGSRPFQNRDRGFRRR